MSSLRQRMTEDMQVRNLSPHTQASYKQQVSLFARHFSRSPEALGPEEIRSYQVYLTNERKLAPSSILIAVAALRFLYKVTLHKDWTFEEVIPAPKKPKTLPIVLSREEVLKFLGCVSSFKHRTILTTCYAAGLRISEAIRLKPTDIDSQRMVVRVQEGKGQKDRYVMLSPKLLEILRAWWRVEKPRPWPFPGEVAGAPITKDAVEQACQKAHQCCRIPKPITPHSLRHAFAVHLLESGTDVRTIQLLLGHRSLATAAQYLRIATSKVCSTTSPFDLLPCSVPPRQSPRHPNTSDRRADGSSQARSGGRLAPLRRSLLPKPRRHLVHRPAARHERDQTVPHRRPRRSYRTVRSVRSPARVTSCVKRRRAWWRLPTSARITLLRPAHIGLASEGLAR